MKMHPPSTFIQVYKYVRAKMIVHAFVWLNMINWTIDIQKK